MNIKCEGCGSEFTVQDFCRDRVTNEIYDGATGNPIKCEKCKLVPPDITKPPKINIFNIFH